MEERRITYQNELHIMIEDYLNNPLEKELDRVIPGLTEEESEERKADIRQVLRGRETYEIPSARLPPFYLHKIKEDGNHASDSRKAFAGAKKSEIPTPL